MTYRSGGEIPTESLRRRWLVERELMPVSFPDFLFLSLIPRPVALLFIAAALRNSSEGVAIAVRVWL